MNRPGRPSCGLVAFSLLSATALVVHAAQQGSGRAAVPAEPIAAILDAFRTHQVVALTDGASSHGDEQNHAFRLSLIRDPRFAAVVNDVVVEFGSGTYQDLIDRFERGEDVPYATLRQVWQNTAQPQWTWDSPIYEEFFRAVRDVNASLPRERQLRVVLGGAPFDWNNVQAARERLRTFDYPLYQRDLLQQQILSRHRRALVVFGSGHLHRKMRGTACQIRDESPDWLGRTASGVFTIRQVSHDTLVSWQPDANAWLTPGLALIRGTTLGAVEDPSTVCGVVRDGKVDPVATKAAGIIHLEDQYDAVLYLGPHESVSQVAPELCADREYMTMRLGRLAVGSPGTELEFAL